MNARTPTIRLCPPRAYREIKPLCGHDRQPIRWQGDDPMLSTAWPPEPELKTEDEEEIER
jgi:hypothetical protein